MRTFQNLLLSLLWLIVPGVVLATPTRITNLTVVSTTSGLSSGAPVVLSFAMPAPGPGLTLAEVDCRRSVGVAISALNWGTRERILPAPSVSLPGTMKYINSLAPYDQATYFACRARDTTWSLVSNLVYVTVPTPTTRNAILEWTAASHPELSGYRIYWRIKNGQTYGSPRTMTIGLSTTAVVSVPWGYEHCFVATSISPTAESVYSNEACSVWGFLL